MPVVFRATREPRYLGEAKRYAKLAADENWMGREQTKHYQFYPFMNAGHFRLHELVDEELGVFAREGHPKSSYYRRGTRVRGYVARRGGYSYVYPDSINTYGDARGRYGAAWSLREQSLERQTPAGPFDHGYFFDSGIGSQFGGQSPYMH